MDRALIGWPYTSGRRDEMCRSGIWPYEARVGECVCENVAETGLGIVGNEGKVGVLLSLRVLIRLRCAVELLASRDGSMTLRA